MKLGMLLSCKSFKILLNSFVKMFVFVNLTPVLFLCVCSCLGIESDAQLPRNEMTGSSSHATDMELIDFSDDPKIFNTTGIERSSLTQTPVPTTASSVPFKKVCRGTRDGLTHAEFNQDRYQQFKSYYTNCTYIDGNLELVFITNASFDLSFLSDIREITGYVLIVGNYVDYIPLTSLRIIRGRTLYKHEHHNNQNETRFYSLYVALNYNPNEPTQGLKELRLNSLHEIQAGSVFIFRNNLLCPQKAVAWNDILTGEGADVYYEDSDPSSFRRPCGQCDPSCDFRGEKYCWGEGPKQCQKLNKISCVQQCDGQCFGPLSNQCCDPECAGGCTGPSKSQCYACKHFDNEGMCVSQCPPEEIYSHREFRKVKNPDARYAYGTLCVKQCPAHLMADSGACVQDCGIGRIAGKDNKCVECDGPCPKTCHISLNDGFVNAQNVHLYEGCTVVQGNIKILDSTFQGDPYYKIPALNVSHLSMYFETVQEVTEFVQIQAYNVEFRSLSFLRNLRVIHGRILDRVRASLHIFKTSLESLGLESLREIKNGAILIGNNSRLCYSNSVNWTKLVTPGQKLVIEHNRNAQSCVVDREVCSEECTSDGCWGPTDDQCYSCVNHRLGKRCIESCQSEPGLYESGPKKCQMCHPECYSACVGAGSDQCDSCSHAQDGPYCVSECPRTKYRDENNVCQLCHENCDESGCTGPRNMEGPGGCKSCSLSLYAENSQNVSECLQAESSCPAGYFRLLANGKQGCVKCHPLCKTCNGAGLSFCTSCKNFWQESRCVEECSSDYYPTITDRDQQTCLRCHSSCLRCMGGKESDCIICKQNKVYLDYEHRNSEPRFSCTEKCPDEAPHSHSVVSDDPDTPSETICLPPDYEARKRIIVAVVISVVAVTFFVMFLVTCLCRKRVHAEKHKKRMEKQMRGECMANVPLNRSQIKPDMSNLVLIKESELTRGKEIGSGAFGTVYRGYWIPENGEQISVAIKVLKEGAQNCRELLDEARIMATVKHPCCIDILSVCLTKQMMLITSLMPLGCLLDYIRKHKFKISAVNMLTWSRQIAEGMDHLQDRGIVHRDLAARNVLVESPSQVRITDFGLAKLVNRGAEESKVTGDNSKVPVRWLAYESVTQRIFDHRSDVWSYGVTVWELCTFGERPYRNVQVIREIPNLLLRGERLPQPQICSGYVYQILTQCWLMEPADRPTFKELVSYFDDMLRNPDRYLYIKIDGNVRLPSQSSAHNDVPTSPGLQSDDGYMPTDQPSQMSPRYSNSSGHFNGMQMAPDRSDTAASSDSVFVYSPNDRMLNNYRPLAGHGASRQSAGDGRHRGNPYTSEPRKLRYEDRTSDDELGGPSEYAPGYEGRHPAGRRLPFEEEEAEDYLEPQSRAENYVNLKDRHLLPANEKQNRERRDQEYYNDMNSENPPPLFAKKSFLSPKPPLPDHIIPLLARKPNGAESSQISPSMAAPSAIGNGLISRPRMDSVYCSDSDRSSPEDHDYYNAFPVPYINTDCILNSNAQSPA